MTELQDVTSDLTADADDLDRLLAGLDAPGWSLPTPAPGWTVAHQVAHLSATFRMAGLAASDPSAFRAMAARLSDDFDANVRVALEPYLASPPDELFARWQAERTSAVRALAAAPPAQPVPWLVRPLPPSVLAAAGMMELFAHGQDIYDALGRQPDRSDRIRHVTAFAVRVWDFGYLARALTPPEAEFRFELTAPSGARWDFGPPDATQRVTGPALDLCLLVTRRRHRADLALRASGDLADRWMDIAQAYRGTPGPGRSAGQFAGSRR